MPGEVSIRMYNVGFGDCFLVTLPTSGGDRRILFDCGTMAAADRPIEQVVARVLADVSAPGQRPRIDVVVCTHRHRDHITGFADGAWSGVEVGEVWMPWTEDPEDPAAARIREAQTSLAAALETNVTALLASPGLSVAHRDELQRALELAANATLNDRAMKTLHDGFRGGKSPRRYFPSKAQDGKPEARYQTDLLPGVTVHVLGPSRDEAVIKDMDPPKGQSYLRSFGTSEAAGGATAPAAAPEPFAEEWWSDAQADLSDQDRARIEGYSDGFAGDVAAALEDAVNGTSLMLLLEIDGTFLLFPGDAQWGTWKAAMERPSSRKLLSAASFYKVGHHGSHNATPKEFVEKLYAAGSRAMVSTRAFGSWKVPKEPLVTQLAARGPVARTDRMSEAPAGTFTVFDGGIETRVPLP